MEVKGQCLQNDKKCSSVGRCLQRPELDQEPKALCFQYPDSIWPPPRLHLPSSLRGKVSGKRKVGRAEFMKLRMIIFNLVKLSRSHSKLGTNLSKATHFSTNMAHVYLLVHLLITFLLNFLKFSSSALFISWHLAHCLLCNRWPVSTSD